MYYEFEVDNNTYKLRLSTRQVVSLERQLGCNPLSIFGNGDRIPTVTEMVAILHNSLTQLNHNITITDAYDIFDKYLADGHTPTDFLTVIIEVYKVSGLIGNEDNTEKN
jgi:hypothetical protein